MRLLITAANGQVGTALTDQALARGLDVVALLDRQLDITDAGAVRRAVETHRPGLVINAAAYTAVDRAEQEPDLAFAVNVEGPTVLAEACERAAIPLVHYSTDYVFDGRLSRPYREGDAPNPLGVYGRSKWEGEQAVRQRLERHVILRLSWVFGCSGQNFVRSILRLCREREELRIVADQRGCPTAASDVAGATLAIAGELSRGRQLQGTYHFCGTPATTWYDFAGAIIDEARHHGPVATRRLIPITTDEYPTAAKRPEDSVLDCAALESVIGIGSRSWPAALPAAVAAFSGRTRPGRGDARRAPTPEL